VSIIKRLLTSNPLKPIEKIADLIEAHEPSVKSLTDEQLKEKTVEFRRRLADGEPVDALLPEAFAVVREASVRTTGMRHFRVQLIGGVVLHQGRIAEMRTGEGKTLVATLPAYLNALTGKGVHIVTVNDYLARRDSEWMGKIYKFLGLSVGLIVHDMEPDERRQSYACDITYGTNNEYGFDYLRDNMVIFREQMVQRELSYAIIDEVDSILIDEARTPLIISGQAEKSTEMYTRANRFTSRLRNETDYDVDEKRRVVTLTEEGVKKAETAFGVGNLSDVENTELNHHINQALRAQVLFKRDVDYVVQNGQVIIVDEFTGRLMLGRRYSEGLHQAIEAKENVRVAHESKTLATITFQNYFRMYGKLAGMTGTAKTEEDEFRGIYSLDVVVIPTHMPMIRKDENDVVFSTEKGKFNAVIDEIVELHKSGRPILVGTVSVERSETLSRLLRNRGVDHEVLNAKNHMREAQIIAQAGKISAVTIATNMAGRGTDILLGGNPDYLARQKMRQDGFEDDRIEEAVSHAETHDEEIKSARAAYRSLYDGFAKTCQTEHNEVVRLGGLHIIGTERHEARRIDNQLRGRAGRQGDPGSSRFYVALDDELMRLFGGERIQGLLAKINPEDDIPMDIGMLSKQIEAAQKRIESRNFEIRKHVLQYDDVMNQQRTIIYAQRRSVLLGENVHGNVMEMIETLANTGADTFCQKDVIRDEWDFDGLFAYLHRLMLPAAAQIVSPGEMAGIARNEMIARIISQAKEYYSQREKIAADAGADMREIERVILLRCVDRHWMDHIDAMDQLRQGVALRAYGHRDPAVEYKFEGFDMFENMVRSIQEDTVFMLYHLNIQSAPQRQAVVSEAQTNMNKADASQNRAPAVKKGGQVGRNDPCPCGSGKKYKNCCGRNAG
jgi:preprotein translocase subunit SecA